MVVRNRLFPKISVERANGIWGCEIGDGTRRLGSDGNDFEAVVIRIRRRRVRILSTKSFISRRYITVYGFVLDGHAVVVPILTTLSCDFATPY